MLLNFRATTSEHVNRLEQVISSVDAGCKNIVCSTSQSEHVEIPFKILFYSPFLREMVASVPLLNESQTVIMPDCFSASVIKHLVSLLSDGYTQISQTKENKPTIIDVAKMLGIDLSNLTYDESTNSSQIKKEPEEREAQEIQPDYEYYEDNIPEVKEEMKNGKLKISAFARVGSDIPNVIQNQCLIPDPAPTMTPLALRAGSPLPSDQYWVCHTCLELFTSQAMYNKHEKVGEKIHKLPCEKFGCKNVMLTKAGALKHMWDVHQEKVKQVKYCGRCQDVVDVKSWTAHEKKDHDSMCGYAGCGAQMPTNKGLWLHMVKKHCYGRNMNPVEESEEEEYEMEDDDMSDFKYYEEIEQVVEADEGEFIKCKVCELLIRRGKIMAHSKKIHKFKCIDGCDLAFTQEHLMFNHCYVEHNNTEHISEKGYLVCPECSEFFESCLQRSYDLHTKTGIHLTCSKCELKFGKSKEDQFKFHQDFAHQAVSDVPCGTCDMVFTSSDTKLLERHRKEEHKVGPCPHCKEISKGNLLFVSKERFMKHHGLEHSLLTTLGCHCAEIINGDVKVHGDIKS